MDKDKMLTLRNWAIVCATAKKDRFGYKIWKQMAEKGYTVYGVNPNYDEIEGMKIYHHLREIEKPIDAIDMVINRKLVPDVLEEAKELGIKNIFFQPGSADKPVIDLAKEMGFSIIEDDCIDKSLNEKEYEIQG